MKNRDKFIILSIPVLLLMIVSIGTTYSLWTVSGQQSSINEISVGCFNVSFSETGKINLLNTYPISDAKASTITPTYSFTITNTCDVTDSYQVNLETMSNSTLNPKWVKAAIQKTHEDGVSVSSTPLVKLVSQNSAMLAIDYFNTTNPTFTLENNIIDPNDNTKVLLSNSASILISGTLAKNKSVTYSLKLWITEEATMDDVGLSTNNKYYSRVVVLHNPYVENNNINSNLLSTNNRMRSNSLTSTTLESAISSFVYDDGTNDHNLRYMGSNVNNYVLFNGELWRIVGIFNSVDDGNGNIQKRIKLVRNSGISAVWSGDNVIPFKLSSIPFELNSVLSSNSSGYVDNAVWNIGTINSDSNSLDVYSMEKNDTWVNTIGMLNASDYGLASFNSDCRSSVSLSNYSTCIDNNYLYSSTDTWLMNGSSSLDKALYVGVSGNVLESDVNLRKIIYPTVFLKNGINVTSGDGSIDNPFVLSE